MVKLPKFVIPLPLKIGVAMLSSSFLLLLAIPPAEAHHAMGNKLPANVFEGFISGLAHPIIGVDHFAFVVAIGLLAALKQWGLLIPMAFIPAALVGTGIHLMSWNLPAPEVFVSTSLLIFGVMLALKTSPRLWVITGLAAIAGLFHGYAYGESIIGAQTTPLLAYLVGFSTIQLGIALLARKIAQSLLLRATDQPLLALRFAGFLLSGAGAAFLSKAVLG